MVIDVIESVKGLIFDSCPRVNIFEHSKIYKFIRLNILAQWTTHLREKVSLMHGILP